MKSVYIVKTKRPLTIDQYNDIGTGTAMKFKVVGKEENCLLTDAHLAMNLDPRGPKIERELYIEAEGKKLKLERVVIDEKKDIALLRIPVGYNVNLFPFKIGHSGELKQGTYINFWGILNDRIQIKEGIISLLDNALSFHLYFKQTNLGGERSDYKTLDAAVNPGNSGGPVIAYRDGRPELVAIIELHMPAESGYQNIGGAINIELFIERLKQDNIVYVQPVQH